MTKRSRTARPNGRARPIQPSHLRSPNLIRKESGGLKSTLSNVAELLRTVPELVGVLSFDAFFHHVVLRRDPPWQPGRCEPPVPPLTDTDVNRCKAWLERSCQLVVPVDLVERAIDMVAREQESHPVRAYLESIRWDGKPRLTGASERYFAAENPGFADVLLRRWLISAVARIYKPGCKADCVLILQGPQGIGKSRALRALGGLWFTDELADLGSKDAALQLQGAWIIELAELDVLGRADSARQKSFLSRTSDRFRPPFKRHVVDVPRQCVFAGTVNHQTYLKDSSGNRRYWPIACGKVDVAGLERDGDQLWAEAVHDYRAKERWWLTREEAELAAGEQELRHDQDEWEGIIGDYLDRNGVDEVFVGQILRDVLDLPAAKWDPREQTRVARALQRLGFRKSGQRRIDGKRPHVYRRVTVSPRGGDGPGDGGGADHRVETGIPDDVTTVTTRSTEGDDPDEGGAGALSRSPPSWGDAGDAGDDHGPGSDDLGIQSEREEDP